MRRAKGERSGGEQTSRQVPGWLALALFLLPASCSSIEPGRHGIQEMRFEGVEQLDDAALGACLISRERDHFQLRLGMGAPTCGKPPFDSSAPTWRIWRWPWTEWPVLNQAVLDQDLERVERWYRARGYYQARVVRVDYDPPEAGSLSSAPCEEGEECTVSITVTIDEGEPTRIQSVEVGGLDELPASLGERARAQISLRAGEIIDERSYDDDKVALVDWLRSQGYALVSVQGRVEIDRGSLEAQVSYSVEPGPLCAFGALQVSGQGELPREPIVAAAQLKSGTVYDPEVLREMQTEVFALGAFSAVEVHEKVDREKARVDVELVVTPLTPDALRLGVGVMSGALRRTDTTDLTSIPQWDFHLFGRYERRHVFGSLGRFTIDERPRLIFNQDFPRVMAPQFGNVVSASLNQPGWVEARTNLFESAAWDYGPDPYLAFVRSDIFFRTGLRRGFFSRRLVGTVAVQQDLFMVSQDPGNQTIDGSELPSSYGYTYLEQDLRLDLRDNRMRSRSGFYAALNATQAVRWQGSDWTVFRLAPEIRWYLPLPWGIVLAQRWGVAGIFITEANTELDSLSQQLGPSVYRLRGGGANSNRGFLAGTLGAGLSGGVRRWESSTELRIPFGESFVLAGFFDVGDVNEQASFRFDHWNASTGFGLRFYTVLGAIRLDTGFRLMDLQRIGLPFDLSQEEDPAYLLGSSLPGAIHLTIGDAF